MNPRDARNIHMEARRVPTSDNSAFRLVDHSLEGDTYFISRHMSDLIAKSLQTYPSNPWIPLEAPGVSGLAVFDDDGRESLWPGCGMSASWLVRPDDGSVFLSAFEHDRKQNLYPLYMATYSPDGTVDVVTWSNPGLEEVSNEIKRDSAAHGFHIIRATWSIMKEKLARVQSIKARTSSGRGRPLKSELKVITLREREGNRTGEQFQVDWSCRWHVRAHWRNQWYPSEQAHRPKLIADYIKGPDDKPFRASLGFIKNLSR